MKFWIFEVGMRLKLKKECYEIPKGTTCRVYALHRAVHVEFDCRGKLIARNVLRRVELENLFEYFELVSGKSLGPPS